MGPGEEADRVVYDEPTGRHLVDHFEDARAIVNDRKPLGSRKAAGTSPTAYRWSIGT